MPGMIGIEPEPDEKAVTPDFAVWTRDLRSGYDRVAADYAEQLYDELRHKPLDRELLDQLAARAGGLGLICDLGCGPGPGGALSARPRRPGLWAGFIGRHAGAGAPAESGH